MKVKIKTILRTDNQEIVKEMNGIFIKEQLQFLEDHTKVILNFKEQSMVRWDSDKKLLYKFINNEETLNELFIYPDNLCFDLRIFTKEFIYDKNFCRILYYLVEEQREVSYQIVWEDVR